MDFILVVIYTSIYLGLIATSFYVLSFIQGEKKETPLYTDKELPNVSVIIPAYNEEKSIARTIRSISKSDYPDFEVIVIDDGSKDNTLKIAKKTSKKLKQNIRVFTKKNGGKATALNLGLKKAKGKIVFSMDADTFVHEKSMKRMVRYFKDPKIMSVTPAMMIHDPKSILQRVQHMEYILGLFLRKTFAYLDSIYIAPGAFSAYRKSFFDKHGGYDEENITEDLEMALRIQSKGYRTENCPNAPAYTIAPSKFKELLVQRRRWYFGLIKNTLDYRKIFSKKYGDLGMFVMPIAWISIIFAVFTTSYLFIRTLVNVYENILFFQNIDFDFFSILNTSLFSLERTLFLFFSNPVVIFIGVFMIFLFCYIHYAKKNVGKIPGKYLSLILFFLFFAILFGFWWIVSIVYALFSKEVNWR